MIGNFGVHTDSSACQLPTAHIPQGPELLVSMVLTNNAYRAEARFDILQNFTENLSTPGRRNIGRRL